MSIDDNVRNSKIAMLMLVLATIFWGSTFIITKIFTQDVPILLFQGIRHAISLIGYIPFLTRLRQINKKVIIAALLTGGANYLMLVTQSTGLQTISAGKAGFITALYVVITPILARILLHTKFQSKNWIAVSFAIIGMAILVFLNPEETSTSSGFSIGEFLVLICAFFAAFQIVFTEKFVKSIDPGLFAMCQLAVITTLLLSSSLIFGDQFNFSSASNQLWWAWIYIGIAATTLPFFFQNWGQKYIESTRAAIIFTMEPIFATLFGVLLANETITIPFVLGGALIMLGIVICSIPSKNKLMT